MNRHSWFRRVFSRDLSISTWIILSVLCLSVIIYAPAFFALRETENAEAEQAVTIISEETTAYSQILLSYALSVDNKNLVQKIASRLAEFKFIYSVTITDIDRNVVASAFNNAYKGRNLEDLKSFETAIRSESNINTKMLSTDLLEISHRPEQEQEILGYINVTSVTSDMSVIKSISKPIKLTVIFTILALLVSLIGLRIAKQALSVIMNAVIDLLKGKRGIRVDESVSGVREVNQFAISFNKMADKVDVVREAHERELERVKFKSNIVQVAAHQLRSPISTMRNNTSLAINSLSDRDYNSVDSYILKVMEATDLLEREVNSILSLSALENNTLPRNDEWINSSEFFGLINKQTKIKYEIEKDISWVCKSSGRMDYDIFIDKNLANIIITNAIENAFKYTEFGYVSLTFSVQEGHLIASIKDSGKGLSEGDIETLMNRPRQLDESITRARDGWGIGMATMQKFSKFLGGEIKITSGGKGFGTQVNVILPIQVRNAIQELAKEDLSFSKVIRDDKWNSDNADMFRVLVIDDSDSDLNDARNLLSPSYLRRNDISVSLCNSANQAICEIEENYYDILFIDFHMPNLDGLCFLRMISEQENLCKESRKVILTNDSNISVSNMSEIESLSDGVMAKPEASEKMRETVSRLTMKVVKRKAELSGS